MITNNASLVSQLGDIVRRGATEAAAGIYNPTIQNLLPGAVQRWAVSIAEQASKRALLQREFRVTITNGAGALGETDYGQLLKGYLRYSYCIIDNDQPSGNVSSDAEETADTQPIDAPGMSTYPAIYHSNYSDLQSGRYLDPSFDHYALRNRYLLFATNGNNPYSGEVKLFASYIPDFTATFPVPNELRDSLLAAVASYFAASPAATTAQEQSSN